MRYGDRLETFLKLQDEQLQALARAVGTRVDPAWQSAAARDLVRELNLLGDREDIYASWLQPGSKDPRFSHPTITNGVHWGASPLSQFTFIRDADVTVPNAETTYITFDTFRGDNTLFYADPGDLSKIRFRSSLPGFQVSGFLNFLGNATGSRQLTMEEFDEAGNSLGSLWLIQPGGALGTSMPVSFVVNWPPTSQIAYMKFSVYQNSGGDLLMQMLRLSAFVV